MNRACLWVLLGVLGCGGQTVEPLDPRDVTMPPETRQWIANAEDGVIAARARLETARRNLGEVQAWRDRIDNEVSLRGNAQSTLDAVMEARVEVASAEVDEAEAGLELSEAKYELANAERAMLHDLAQYDLEPIRERAVSAERQLLETRRDLRRKREALDRATTTWWTSFGSYVASGGSTATYWIGDAEQVRVTEGGAPRASQPSRNPASSANTTPPPAAPPAGGSPPAATPDGGAPASPY